METRPLRASGITLLFNDFDAGTAVICPKPRYAAKKVPYWTDSVKRTSSRSASILRANYGDSDVDVLNGIHHEDEDADDSDMNNQVEFFCGSPPRRTGNPVVFDNLFTERNQTYASRSRNLHETNFVARAERGSSCASACGGKHGDRIECPLYQRAHTRREVSVLA